MQEPFRRSQPPHSPRRFIALLSSACLLSLASAQAQNVPEGPAIKPDNPNAQLHTDLAYKLAGDDYFKITATLQCRPPGVSTPPVAAKDIPPTRVFDNLYYVGLADVGAWAVNTSDGIILIDTLNTPSDAENVIVPGLKKMGLDPAKIKYIVITHAHGDHYGGAAWLSEKFGARVAMSEADWQVLERPPQSRPAGPPPGAGGPGAPGGPGGAATPGRPPRVDIRPKRDMVVSDGQKLTLGDTTLTIVATSGHTPGTISIIIPVKDKGKPHMVALWGGTGIPQAAADREAYVRSVGNMMKYATAAGVDAEISNHAFVDDGLNRMEVLRARKPGEPNPFVIGADTFGRFMGVIEQCAKTAIARQAG